uniref:Uncharacterized protein n=1 Tax=viral metagenome TaxID=1070528 RepID=A0A6M3IHX2_9ZZZZ
MPMLENELDILILKAHRSGLNYWQILKVLLLRCGDLMMQSEAEYYVKGGN